MLLLLALVTLSPCVNAVPTEIAYDNGILGGNDAIPFVGVRFSLPPGVTSAELLTVRFYWLNAGDPVTIHITAADHVTELTTPIQSTGGGRTPLFKDLDVSNLGIILTGDFFIILQQYPVSGVQNFGIDTSPKVGRSYFGETMSDMIPLYFSGSDLGNILLRAVVEPAWNTTTAFSSLTNSAVNATQSGATPSSTQPVSFQGAWGSYGNGTGQFHIPTAVAVDSSGNVYVADTGNDRVEKFTSTGTFISQWGTSGTGPGQFNKPWGVAVDSSGNVYVTDTGNSRVEKFTGSGLFVSQWGTRGGGPGQFSFLSPVGIAVDSSGDVYVVDTFNSRVEKFTGSGTYLTQFGSGGSGSGQLSGPNSVAVDSAGNVFVTDAGNSRVEEFAPSGTFTAMFGGNGTGPGQFTAAYGIAIDPSGNVYVVDGADARVEVFTGSGTFLFQWPCATGACPTGAGSGQFQVPYGIAIASSGLTYITDMDNNQVAEFSITSSSSSSIATSSTSSLSMVTSSTSSMVTPGPSPNSGFSQSTLLLVGVIVVLVVLLVVVMLRRRGPSPPSSSTGAVGDVVYCRKCGTQNAAAQQFCEKCGAKLVKI